MKNKATLKKQNRLIAEITGEYEPVKEFIDDSIRMNNLVPKDTTPYDWNDGISDRWTNGDVVLTFNITEPC